jgi:hypothetical protein
LGVLTVLAVLARLRLRLRALPRRRRRRRLLNALEAVTARERQRIGRIRGSLGGSRPPILVRSVGARARVARRGVDPRGDEHETRGFLLLNPRESRALRVVGRRHRGDHHEDNEGDNVQEEGGRDSDDQVEQVLEPRHVAVLRQIIRAIVVEVEVHERSGNYTIRSSDDRSGGAGAGRASLLLRRHGAGFGPDTTGVEAVEARYLEMLGDLRRQQ